MPTGQVARPVRAERVQELPRGNSRWRHSEYDERQSPQRRGRLRRVRIRQVVKYNAPGSRRLQHRAGRYRVHRVREGEVREK